MLPTWILLAVGGALGTLARYAVSIGIQAALPVAWVQYPAGTLGVNIVGCLLIGLLMGLSGGLGLNGPKLAEPARLLLVTGFLGGFTTFSSYALELSRLFSMSSPVAWVQAIGYLVLSNGLGVAAVFLGNWLGRIPY